MIFNIIEDMGSIEVPYRVDEMNMQKGIKLCRDDLKIVKSMLKG